MSEGRRRQIIKHAEPAEARREEAFAPEPIEAPEYDYPHENLLEKRIYLSWPMMILGMVSIMLMSFLVTFVVVKWPEGELVIAPDPSIARLKADLAEEHLPVREAILPRAMGVEAPAADLAGSAMTGKTAMVSPERLPERSFDKDPIAAASPPVAEMTPATRAEASIEGKAALPGLRQAYAPPRAAAAERPIADLSLQSFAANFDVSPVDVPDQKLMLRRYANAPSRPLAEMPEQTFAEPNRKAIETVAGSPGERSFKPKPVDAAEGPIADLQPATLTKALVLETANVPEEKMLQRRYANRAGAPAIPEGIDPLAISVVGGGLPERHVSLRQALETESPVADLTPRRETIPEISPKAAIPDQKLLSRRYANRAGAPVLDGAKNPLEIPVTGDGLPERHRSFASALGIKEPVADVNPGGFDAPIGQPLADVPGQRLMQRRYAKAVTAPEKLDVAVQPAIEIPSPAGQGIAPGLSAEEAKPWRRYAARVPDGIAGKGRIVIIIDDMGNNPAMSRRLGDLPGPLNFAFLPYAPGLAAQTASMRAKGHELLVHLPMEPEGDERPGPHALLTEESNQTIASEIEWNLSQFDGFVGVNNHMGSRFTEDPEKMRLVMLALKEKGLLFLDSLTSPRSKGRQLARAYGLPWASRDVFLDNIAEDDAILAQLEKVERLANENGVAIAIGHPNVATYRVLKDWIPTLKGKGLVLVPLSSVVKFEAPAKLANVGGAE